MKLIQGFRWEDSQVRITKHEIRTTHRNKLDPCLVIGWRTNLYVFPFPEMEDVRNAVVFLLDDDKSSMINGIVLPVDGGHLVT